MIEGTLNIPSRPELFVSAAELPHDRAYEGFCVSKEHERLVEVVERVVDPCKSGCHAALDDHYGARFVYIQNGHAVDRAVWVRARRGIGHVVRADHQGHIGLRKISID